MYKTLVTAAMLCMAARCLAAEPAVDNERVMVRTLEGPGGRADHDFVAVSLTDKGTAVFGHRGDIPGKAGSQTVVIELKDHPVAPSPILQAIRWHSPAPAGTSCWRMIG